MGRDAKVLQQGYNKLRNKLEQSQLETLKTLEDLKRTEAELDTCTSQLDESQKQASVAIVERSTMEQNAQHREASMKAEVEQTLDSEVQTRRRTEGDGAETVRGGQKRNYDTRTPGHQDTRTRGQHFRSGELVWVYSPQRKKGRCPKLDSQWVAEYWRGWG
ncbi:hypothetical protein CesoFtcFv8_007953 [Champsocephalus esox]|uniref:Uncharacterized protein n=1 Tax=Champsocephalus esox TaxID=159716 RepID=A0AAN8H513_9TELE|nr:hypothetical protein CesoFtcFv8_007953 [Champsocephalus esox]